MRTLHLTYITDTCIFHFAPINDIITEQMIHLHKIYKCYNIHNGYSYSTYKQLEYFYLLKEQKPL